MPRVNTVPMMLSDILRRVGSSLRRITSAVLIAPIRFYQMCISPLTPPTCRFTPPCSSYAVEAIRLHGPLKGLYLAVRRILRCRPGGGFGYDPVPEEFHFFPKDRKPQ